MKIQHNDPPPKSNPGRKRVHPWYEMKVGDSCLVGTEYNPKRMARLSAMAISAMRQKSLDWKFSFRKTEEGGIRCYRIK